MLSFLNVMLEYKSLIVKMHLDLTKKNKVVQNNMVLFGGLELILGVLCLLPMLEVVHILIEFALCGDVLIVDL